MTRSLLWVVCVAVGTVSLVFRRQFAHDGLKTPFWTRRILRPKSRGLWKEYKRRESFTVAGIVLVVLGLWIRFPLDSIAQTVDMKWVLPLTWLGGGIYSVASWFRFRSYVIGLPPSEGNLWLMGSLIQELRRGLVLIGLGAVAVVGILMGW